MKPLFIPLNSAPYDDFAAGRKTYELRVYGARWNEKTCPPGRDVLLSRGYGTKNRMRSKVGSFRQIPWAELEKRYQDELLANMGADKVVGNDIAFIQMCGV